MSHEGSGTSRRFIGGVLPVGVYSARQYLGSLGHGRLTAAAVLLGALAVRVAFVPLADADARDHVRGIVKSARAVLGRTAPRLPDYEEN